MASPASDLIERLSEQGRRQLAVRIADILSPYGSMEFGVVSAGEFEDLLRGLDDGYGRNDAALVDQVRDRARAIIARFDEEPIDDGFYVLAAVVALYYATEAVVGYAAQAATNAAARLEDVLGFATDDGCPGAYQAALSWLFLQDAESEQTLRATVKADATRRNPGRS